MVMHVDEAQWYQNTNFGKKFCSYILERNFTCMENSILLFCFCWITLSLSLMAVQRAFPELFRVVLALIKFNFLYKKTLDLSFHPNIFSHSKFVDIFPTTLNLRFQMNFAKNCKGNQNSEDPISNMI